MRRLTPTATALLCAGALVAPAAVAQVQEQSDGTAADIRSMGAIAPIKPGPRARQVYESLIPNGLSMPAEPRVGVWLAELSVPAFVPGRPLDPVSHWLEGAIQIRVKHGEGAKAEEGWLNIHYPVTAEFWFQAGRAVGLPKRHATASITQSGAGWTATATPTGVAGGPSYVMEWQPQAGLDKAVIQSAFRIPLEPFFALNPPLEGPTLNRVHYKVGPPFPWQASPTSPPPIGAGSEPEGGMVRLRLRPDLDAYNEDLPKIMGGATLDEMVEVDQTVPGAYAFYSVSLNSETTAVGEGGYGPRRPGGGDSAACSRRKAVRLRFPRGVRVRRVLARSGSRRLAVRRLRGRRVRVGLGRLGAGRHRVRVTFVTKRGRRLVRVRRVRVCG